MILSSSQCHRIFLSRRSETSVSPSPCQVLPLPTKLAAPFSPPPPSTSSAPILSPPPSHLPLSLSSSFNYGAH